MKVTSLLISFILGGLIGWASGFLQIPLISSNNYFIYGFLFGISFLSILAFVYLFMKKKGIVFSKSSPYFPYLIFSILFFFIAAFSISGNIFLYKQNQWLSSQRIEVQKQIAQLSETIETTGSGNLAQLMNLILDKANEEMKIDGALSDSTIKKIATLSYTFKPYLFYEGDSLIKNKISPERGQLLLALLMMDIDSVSFYKIKTAASFSGADLRSAQLANADLSYADLSAAHLKQANLSHAILNNTNLTDANLFAADLDSSFCNATNFKRANLALATCNDAQLILADFNGANMLNTQFINANFYQVKMQWSNLSGAMFNAASMNNTDLMGALLSKSNFTEADLVYADLRLVKADDAIFTSIKLNHTIVDADWFKKIDTWHLIGKNEINIKYFILNDTVDHFKAPLYRIVKKD